ncbi:hypothetical protein [Clostridium botulinum]|nr:hypothetical protein [Clostridium botulinum]
MKVEYVGDKTLRLNNEVHAYLLPKCPYCDEYLEYPEVEESE